MSHLSLRSHRPTASSGGTLLALLALALALATLGCRPNSHTSDPRLRKIDEMLAAQLPKGTAEARVTFFLHSRGFPVENSSERNTVVALVRLVDTDTLLPATARVTFHFDPQDRLTTYDMQSAPDNSTQ
jgi:hypothetical protein